MKKYSTPSRSFRAAPASCTTPKIPGCRDRRAHAHQRALPRSDGPDTMIRLPLFMSSFHVLDLLAQLFDIGLDGDPQPGDLQVPRWKESCWLRAASPGSESRASSPAFSPPSTSRRNCPMWLCMRVTSSRYPPGPLSRRLLGQPLRIPTLRKRLRDPFLERFQVPAASSRLGRRRSAGCWPRCCQVPSMSALSASLPGAASPGRAPAPPPGCARSVPAAARLQLSSSVSSTPGSQQHTQVKSPRADSSRSRSTAPRRRTMSVRTRNRRTRSANHPDIHRPG